MRRRFLPAVVLFLSTLVVPVSISAHPTADEFSGMTTAGLGLEYFWMGFKHIIPFGIDHILFVLGIFLFRPQLKSVFLQATVFTVAHSITLGLAMFGVISPVPSVIEPVIALSIVFIGMENIFIRELQWPRFLIIFLFGLIHGCGFAGVLSEAGLHESNFILTLFTFNAGIEAGQLAVILIAFILLAWRMKDKKRYRKYVIIPGSLCISIIAAYWTIERIAG